VKNDQECVEDAREECQEQFVEHISLRLDYPYEEIDSDWGEENHGHRDCRADRPPKHEEMMQQFKVDLPEPSEVSLPFESFEVVPEALV